MLIQSSTYRHAINRIIIINKPYDNRADHEYLKY